MTIRTLYVLVLALASLAWAGGHMLHQFNGISHKGLPHLSSSLESIGELPQRQRVLGYERRVFGNGWQDVAGTSCTAREVAIASQRTAPASCEIAAGTLLDPYNLSKITLTESRSSVEVDHVIPLSAAWDLGAFQWETRRRIEFANDPLNLVVTASSTNQEKSDQLPSAWMPPQPRAHCWYSTRVAAVAAKYGLDLPAQDIKTMTRSCRLSFTLP